MDSGVWLLKCGGCHQTFEIEISDETTLIIDLIKDTSCPHCHMTPTRKADPSGRANWHEIIKFQVYSEKLTRFGWKKSVRTIFAQGCARPDGRRD